MPNGSILNEELEFSERITHMTPDERTIFVAKQTYTLTTKFDNISTKVDALDTKFDECISGNGANKKTSGVTGGVTAAVIVGIVEGLKAIFQR